MYGKITSLAATAFLGSGSSIVHELGKEEIELLLGHLSANTDCDVSYQIREGYGAEPGNSVLRWIEIDGTFTPNFSYANTSEIFNCYRLGGHKGIEKFEGLKIIVNSGETMKTLGEERKRFFQRVKDNVRGFIDLLDERGRK